MSFRLATLALAAASAINASPCPFGQMAESGQLSEAEAAKFFKARSEGDHAVRDMIDEHAEKQKRDFAAQEEHYKRQLNLGGLKLGGGLLNGVLQPFSGILQGLDVPTPQPVGLAKVPDAAHPFKYPGATDVRGMCPTLNTMANHGYISRNGITTFAEASNACQQTLGFGYDTCSFLSALGLIAGGDLPTGKYSIGGADSRVPNTIGPALGISHHGIFEVDQSISRVDSALGNQASFNLDRWNRLVDISKKHDNQFNIQMWNEERGITYQESRDTNPDFQFEAKGLAVTLAERVFIFRALPNGTREDLADFANVAPFYLNETFPDNWFKRDTAYGLYDVATDIADLLLMNPTTELGRNVAGNWIPSDTQINKYTPGDLMCFLETALLDLGDGQFSTALSSAFDTYNAFVDGALRPFFANHACDNAAFAKPGQNAGNTTPGKSTPQEALLEGVYQSTTPSEPPHEF